MINAIINLSHSPDFSAANHRKIIAKCPPILKQNEHQKRIFHHQKQGNRTRSEKTDYVGHIVLSWRSKLKAYATCNWRPKLEASFLLS